jgi:hypothetical protein
VVWLGSHEGGGIGWVQESAAELPPAGTEHPRNLADAAAQ